MKKNVHFLLLWPTALWEGNVVANVEGLQRGFWAISLVFIPLEYAPREEMQGLAYNWSLDWLISCMHTQARPGVDKVEPALAYRRLTHLTHGVGTGSPRRNVRRVDKVEPTLRYRRRLTHMARMEASRSQGSQPDIGPIQHQGRI